MVDAAVLTLLVSSFVQLVIGVFTLIHQLHVHQTCGSCCTCGVDVENQAAPPAPTAKSPLGRATITYT